MDKGQGSQLVAGSLDEAAKVVTDYPVREETDEKLVPLNEIESDNPKVLAMKQAYNALPPLQQKRLEGVEVFTEFNLIAKKESKLPAETRRVIVKLIKLAEIAYNSYVRDQKFKEMARAEKEAEEKREKLENSSGAEGLANHGL